MYRYQPELNLTPEEVLDYLRKSQSDDPLLTVEEVLSKHETILDEWAEKNLGGKVPEGNKYREVISGETIKDRPEINKVLRRIESPKIKAVKVVEPQRLTRGDLEDIGRLMKLFKHTDTLIITPVRVYDLRDEYDWDAFERELKRGNEFLEYTKKILNRGRLLSVSQGNYLGSRPPYGYERTTVMDGKRKCPTLKIKEDEANVIRMIFDMYVNKNMGGLSICRYLDSMGIKPPRGQHWSYPAVQDMLENVHYIGKVRWNWRKTVHVVEEGEIKKTSKHSKVGEYLIYDGKHEAIISEELFNAAQAKKGKNHRAKVSTKIRNPLAGLLFCHCGRAMSLRFYPKPGGGERLAPRLSCENQVHCNTGSCRFPDIIERICSVLEECIKDFERRIENNTGDAEKLHAKLIKNLEQKLKDLQAKELAQWEAQTDPNSDTRMPPEIFKQLNERLLKEKDEVQQALCKAYESMPDPVDYEEELVRFKEALAALQDPEADPALQNRLLKSCIERIEYKRDKPERLKKEPGEKKGTRFKTVGGRWTEPPIFLDIKLKTKNLK